MRRNIDGVALVALACWFAIFATVVSAADFVVINTSATGPGSLTHAIENANSLPGPDRIVFNIPGPGIHKIDVSSSFLPTITDPLTIDGYTQPGSKPNALEMGDHAVVLIQIDGGYNAPQYSSPAGIAVSASDCTIRGLMITRFAVFTFGLGGGGRLGGFGVAVGGERCVVEGNFIGTDGTGDTTLGNQSAGILVAASRAQIGGNTPAARNLIGGNAIGVWASSNETLDNVVVAGNQIGTNPPPAGEQGPNESTSNEIGLVLSGGFINSVIGGVHSADANLISGNGIGIRTGYTNSGTAQTTVAHGALIQGNLIGLQPLRAAGAEISQTIGIEVLGTDHLIGGLSPGAGNQIAFNETGVAVVATNYGPTAGNRITSNQIYANSNLGIDLGRDGPTSNDFGDGDDGPNHLQNFPIITSIEKGAASTTVTGSLNSTPSMAFTLQLFGTIEGDSHPTLLETRTITTNDRGFAEFQVVYPGPVVAASLTATATDPDGNTSELLPPNGPVQFANISTRGSVGTGDNIMIGGFIVRSNSPKKVIVRALGPSLPVSNHLSDPYLEIYDSAGTLLAKNDDWKGGQQQEIMDSGVPPSSDVESAVVVTLPGGNYTAQVRGVSGATGVGIVEIYDLDHLTADSGRIVNISTRGFVGTNDDVLIGGFIVRGDHAARAIVRAIGPDLTAKGVAGALDDPVLELHNGNGTVLAVNDDWQEGQAQEIRDTQLQPGDERDAAVVASLAPGNYTAIVRGKDNSAGVALVEFYDLKP